MLSPNTWLGEVIDVFIDYFALVVLTLPIAIIGRNFHNQYEAYFRCVALLHFFVLCLDLFGGRWGVCPSSSTALTFVNVFCR